MLTGHSFYLEARGKGPPPSSFNRWQNSVTCRTEVPISFLTISWGATPSSYKPFSFLGTWPSPFSKQEITKQLYPVPQISEFLLSYQLEKTHSLWAHVTESTQIIHLLPYNIITCSIHKGEGTIQGWRSLGSQSSVMDPKDPHLWITPSSMNMLHYMQKKSCRCN